MIPAPWPYKIFVVLSFGLAYGIFYQYPNLYPVLEPMRLPMLPWEDQIPVIPWTFLLYTSDYVLLGLAVCLLNNPRAFHSFVRQMVLVLAISGMFFWLTPTICPRPDVIQTSNAFFQWLIRLVWTLDAKVNSFPSLHVAFTLIAVWNLRSLGKPVFWLFSLWAVLVTVSVITTKQHYILDIPGALAVAITASLLDRWLLQQPGIRPWLYRWEATPWWNFSFPRKPVKTDGSHEAA